MSAEDSATPLSSFEAKWSAAYPEFGLALRFIRGADRDAQSAFACLVFEIEHAAFAIREAQPAAIKLQWWAEELTRAGHRKARHPLTTTLGDRLAGEAVPAERWHEVIAGAFAQRDAEPAADGATLIERYADLYAPLGAVDAALFGTDARAVAGMLALRRALRETAALRTALQDGKLPLPMDMLATYRLTRGDLGAASEARGQLLREWLTKIGSELRGVEKVHELVIQPPGVTDRRRIGALRAVMAAVDGKRASRARLTPDPLATLNDSLGRLSISDVWSAWRAARRSRA